MASPNVSKEVIDGIEAVALECSLCMERFKNPKSLPCIHSFCLGCLEKWVKESNGRRFSCPICREVCQVPRGGLQDLKNNSFIIGLLDYVTKLEDKSDPPCGCKREAAFVCQDCDELYCQDCKDTHCRMKIAKDHSIITIKEYNSRDPAERFASKHLNCSEHKMPLQFFCETDKIPICVGCIQVQHPKGESHKIIDIKDAFESFSNHASQLIKISDKKCLGLDQMLNELKEKESEMNSNFTKCEADIAKQAAELHQLIDRHKEEQLQNLKKCHKQNWKTLETQASEMELTRSKLSTVREITYNLTKSPNQTLALMSSHAASEQLEKLLNSAYSSTKRIGVEVQTNKGILGYNPNRRSTRILASNVVDRLRRQETRISPSKSTVTFTLPRSMLSFLVNKDQDIIINVITRNSLGETVYVEDAEVKCLGIFLTAIDRCNMLMKEISVTDKHNGCYEICGNIPLQRTTFICLIIDRSDVYVNTIFFDNEKRNSKNTRHFEYLLNS
ncbi:tripartite motif-containing protein 45-like [Anneissia japonica]|uniref:tripartite motif-containing protein 45-like n=1 Tax=Anneissia japonica TaxID=1529436 RepID=UPI0014258393|nr:tripartite motif-containing protein 45-like [Anneissia japonica]XP_033111424.1 tripartite motif-containing protein 45-like [Anneissia japonica]